MGVGLSVGFGVGSSVGLDVGRGVGCGVGCGVGFGVGCVVGDAVGNNDNVCNNKHNSNKLDITYKQINSTTNNKSSCTSSAWIAVVTTHSTISGVPGFLLFVVNFTFETHKHTH